MGRYQPVLVLLDVVYERLVLGDEESVGLREVLQLFSLFSYQVSEGSELSLDLFVSVGAGKRGQEERGGGRGGREGWKVGEVGGREGRGGMEEGRERGGRGANDRGDRM